ncbi:hypothetical protein LCGC14_2449810, partial [marine sediment metagenome]
MMEQSLKRLDTDAIVRMRVLRSRFFPAV